MAKFRLLVIGALWFAFTLNASPCGDLDNSSCWHLVNNANHPVQITCDGMEIDGIFSHVAVREGQTYSKQFNMAYGDGLGYPRPDSFFDCTITYGMKRAHLIFRTLDWGDRVRFTITNSAAKVELLGMWDNSSKVMELPFRGPSM